MNAGYLTVGQAAEYLSVTEAALRAMIRRRDIPFIRMGRRIRFDVNVLDRWMRNQQIEAI